MEAAHSAALVRLLRSPLGYKGLLGLKTPPSTIQHPSLWELWEAPLWAHVHLVREAMRQ